MFQACKSATLLRGWNLYKYADSMNLLSFECTLNAESLVKASKILSKNKFYGYASALAVLAIEEVGKAFDLQLSNPKPRDIQAKFYKHLKSHKEKLHIAAFDKFFGGLMREGLFSKDKPVKSIEEYQQRYLNYIKEGNPKFMKLLVESSLYKYLPRIKEMGLYIDFQNGEITTPRDVKRKTASFLIKQAESRIKEFYIEFNDS